jgi:hypothetical protein
MPDREKVIKGTEICLTGGAPQRCLECPYHNDGCDRQRMQGTLELLKEQEAEIRQLRLALDIAKRTCNGIKVEGR